MTDKPEDIQYYDEVEEGAHARSAENRSEPDPRSRDLWQTANISTDGNGPGVSDVAPIFAQARADALRSDPNVADEDAEAAQDEADRLRNSIGYVAPTGPDAGIYDDPTLEGQVPDENFSPAPEPSEEEREARDAAASREDASASAVTVPTDEADQQVPVTEPVADEPVEEPAVAEEDAPVSPPAPVVEGVAEPQQ